MVEGSLTWGFAIEPENDSCPFLLKTAPPDQLIAAVRDAAGDMAFSPDVLRRVVGLASRAGAARGPALPDTLSDREREVALAVADGLTNAQISQRLYLSVATVKTYVNRLFDKTGVTNRGQLALLVERSGARRDATRDG